MNPKPFQVILAAALVAMLFGSFANAAVITATYVNIQTSDNIDFNTAIGNVSTLSDTTRILQLPVGAYFRFGIAITVTGEPNPLHNSDWENQVNVIQPSNLGLAGVAMKVSNSDATGAKATPIASISPRTGDPNNATKSRAKFVGFWTAGTEPGDVGATSSGSPNYLGSSGVVGNTYPLFVANASVDSINAPSLAGAFTTKTIFFDSLTYQFRSENFSPVSLTPTIDLNGTLMWSVNNLGDPDHPFDDPGHYQARHLATSLSSLTADTVVNAGPLTIQSPEPASLVAFSLGMTALIGRRRLRTRI